MAVSRNGKQLDLAKIKSALIESRDKGTVSKGDYRKAMKGLDKISEAGKKGIDYQFTGENRFKTVSTKGVNPTLNEAGVGINTKLPVFGKGVSKAMGFASKFEIPNEPKSFDEQKEEALPPSAGSKKTESSSANPATYRFDFNSEKADSLLSGSVPAIEKKEIKIELPDLMETGATEAPEKKATDSSKATYPNFVSRSQENKPEQKTLNRGHSPVFNPEGFNAQKKKDINQGFYDQGKNKNVIPVAKPGSSDFEGRTPVKANDWNPIPNILEAVKLAVMPKGGIQGMRDRAAKLRNTKSLNSFSKGGKIVLFGNGGNSVTIPVRFNPKGIMNRFGREINSVASIGPKRNPFIVSPDVKGISNQFGREISAPLIMPDRNPFSVKPEMKGVTNRFGQEISPAIVAKRNPYPNLKITVPGDRKTLSTDSQIESAKSENTPGIDKDSVINTALGLYGAGSLATAKRPKLRAPKDLNLFVRPAQGDEDMVSRSSNAIAEGVRQGTGMLRSRAGSDIQSYVQGATAMVDSQGKNMSAVLGQNAQLKRADEDRMSQEINAGKQMNWQAKEQFRQEENFNDQNAYAQRVAGAQGAVNNSLNFGVQKRADQRNKAVELKSANARYGTMMLSLADSLLAQGYTPEEVMARLENVKKVSKGELTFKNGGKITSERMAVNAHENLAKSTQEMRKILAMYTKFISDASIQNIRDFNRNIRAINERKNITITRR